jgi:acyl carrier protein
MQQTIEETLRSHLLEHFAFGNAAAIPSDGESLNEAGIVDSAGVLALILFIEEAFAITVTDDDVHPDNLDSIAKLAAFIRVKLAAKDEGN